MCVYMHPLPCHTYTNVRLLIIICMCVYMNLLPCHTQMMGNVDTLDKNKIFKLKQNL